MKLIHLGWSFKSSVLAPRGQPWCHAYVSTSWGRKLPNLGKINANGIDCQEQVRVYWWHIDSLIYNGQDTINNSNLDSLQKNSCLMDPQFHFSRNYYKLKLVHDVNERDICPRGGRSGKCRGGSRGRGCIHRLHTRPLSSQLRYTPPDRLLANGNHDMEERRGRNGDVHVCEDACDSQRKDELIMCSYVLIAIYNRYYHVWGKIYRKIFHERKKETITRLNDGVIVWSRSEYKGHHIKDPWTLSKLSCREI